MTKLYTIKEFTSMFGVSRDTYYNWKANGVITPIKVGGSVRIPEDQILKLLEQFQPKKNGG
jgi:excisionase family DNA binding protein